MKKRTILTSLMSVAMLATIASGATYALFTSEDTTNIAVTAGKVDLTANIVNVETWSLENDYSAAGRSDGSFTMGGSALVSGSTVTLDRIVPGDRVKFKVAGTNNSNVNIQYRVSIQAKDTYKLLEGLKIEINGNIYSSLYGYKTAWASLNPGTAFEDIEISIELPKEAGNEYQDLTANLVILVEAVQGNAEVNGVAEVTTFEVVDDVVDFRNAFVDLSRSINSVRKHIALEKDIELDADEVINVLSGKAYDLDLNGFAIYAKSDMSGNRELFNVKGELNVLNGTLEYKHVGSDMGWSSMTTIFDVTAGGKLGLNNVNASNLGGTSMAFVAHLNNWGEASLEIDDSSLFSTYCAVRVFNSGPDVNNVTVTDSTLAANNMAVWVHNYTSVDFADKLYSGSSASYDVEKVKDRLNFNFLVENPVNGVADGDASNLNEKANNIIIGKIRYGFTDGEIYYNSSVKSTTDFNDLWSLISADKSEVVLYDNLYANYFIGVNGGKESYIDLNGKTIDVDYDAYFGVLAIEGSELTIDGEGTVNLKQGFFVNSENSKLNIKSGNYNMTAATTLNGMKAHSVVQGNANVVIEDGKFSSNVENASFFQISANGRIEVKGGFFENTADATPDYFDMGTNKYNTNRVIITGGTFVNWNPLNDRMCYTGTWPAAGESQFSGPWMLIPGDYKVVSELQPNGDIWYSVVHK